MEALPKNNFIKIVVFITFSWISPPKSLEILFILTFDQSIVGHPVGALPMMRNSYVKTTGWRNIGWERWGLMKFVGLRSP